MHQLLVWSLFIAFLKSVISGYHIIYFLQKFLFNTKYLNNLDIVYVDNSLTNAGDGSALTPYNDINAAINRIKDVGGSLLIKPGKKYDNLLSSYVFTKNIIIR